MKRLAIVTTHPIQYNAPLFRLLNERGNVCLKVFYTWGQSKNGTIFDPSFGIDLQWDIPLLEGYEFEFVENIASKPGSHHFLGINNPSLVSALEAYSPDAILVYGWNFISHIRVMLHFRGKVRILFRGDSTLLDEPSGPSMKKLVRRVFLKFVYRNIDVALYVGENNRRYFIQHGVSPDKLRHVPHCIDNERFAGVNTEYSEAASEWRRSLGINYADICYLYAGKLEKKKGVELLLRAFKELESDRRFLIIAGNGKMEKSLRALAADDQRIIFLPFQNQSKMPVLYRVGDVFVLPSIGPGETWGLALNEAMACGKTVIASDKCGGALDLIDASNGLIFPSGNLRLLKCCLQAFSNKQDLIERGYASVKKVTSFSLELQATAIEKIVGS